MGFKIKGLKKVFKNFTHSKLYKSLPFSHYESKIRRKLGLTGHRVKRLGRSLRSLYMPNVGVYTSLNSAGAVIPHTSNRSVTDLY